MTDIAQSHKALLARILEGDGTASPTQRRAAFDNASAAASLGALIDKVAKHAHQVTDEDFAAARAAGLDEDQIFELVICAAIGEANRQYTTALAALDAASSKE